MFARHENHEKEEMLELSRKLESDFIVPVPPGLDYLPHQRAGIEFCVRNPNINSLIADEPGLGKTIEAIGFCNFHGFTNISVICPASLITNWAREIKKWHVAPVRIQIIFSSKQEIDPTADVHICSYSLIINKKIQAFFQRKRPEVTLIDESHKLKNPAAKRTIAVYTSKGNIVDRSKYVINLTGTPIVNRPIEIFQTVSKLCPQAINGMDYERFAMRYCDGYWDRDGFHDDGASNQRELGHRLRSHYMVRRRKEQVLKDLPPKMRSIVSLVPTKGASKIVKEMSKFNAADVIRMKGVTTSFEGLSEMRRELGEVKAPIAAEYLKTQLDGGRKKIIVFAHHSDTIDILDEFLEEYGTVVLKGSTPKHKRQDIVDIFQNDPESRVFIGSLTACGEGLTLTAADYLAFVEFSYVPGENEQCEDRAHRIGQLYSVLIEYLIFENSLDENVLRSQTKKDLNIKEIMT